MSSKPTRQLDISLKGAYLVGLPEVLTELGLPDDFGKILNKFHELAGEKLLVGESTLSKAKRDGYSERTIKKLIEPFGIRPESINPQVDTTDKLFKRAVEVQSPMPQWWGLKSFSDEIPEYELVWQYIEKRIRNDIAIREALLDGEALSEVTDPNLRAELLRIGQLMSELCNYREDLSEQQLNQLSAIASEMDFYFGLFAHFEVGHKKQLALSGGPVIRRCGLSEVIRIRSKKEERSCFGAFLNLLRLTLGKEIEGRNISWNELAAHIKLRSSDSHSEMPEAGAIARLREVDELKRIKDSQHRIINQWRSGKKKDLPGTDKLINFLSSVLGGSEGLEYLFLQAKIAQVFDQKLVKWDKDFKEIELPPFDFLDHVSGVATIIDQYWDLCLNVNWPIAVELKR